VAGKRWWDLEKCVACHTAHDLRYVIFKVCEITVSYFKFDELYLSAGEKGNSKLSRPPRKRGLKLRVRGTMDKDKPPIIGGCDRKGNIRLSVLDHFDSDVVFTFLLI
jgi:hypothetical protein